MFFAADGNTLVRIRCGKYFEEKTYKLPEGKALPTADIIDYSDIPEDHNTDYSDIPEDHNTDYSDIPEDPMATDRQFTATPAVATTNTRKMTTAEVLEMSGRKQQEETEFEEVEGGGDLGSEMTVAMGGDTTEDTRGDGVTNLPPNTPTTVLSEDDTQIDSPTKSADSGGGDRRNHSRFDSINNHTVNITKAPNTTQRTTNDDIVTNISLLAGSPTSRSTSDSTTQRSRFQHATHTRSLSGTAPGGDHLKEDPAKHAPFTSAMPDRSDNPTRAAPHEHNTSTVFPVGNKTAPPAFSDVKQRIHSTSGTKKSSFVKTNSTAATTDEKTERHEKANLTTNHTLLELQVLLRSDSQLNASLKIELNFEHDEHTNVTELIGDKNNITNVHTNSTALNTSIIHKTSSNITSVKISDNNTVEESTNSEKFFIHNNHSVHYNTSEQIGIANLTAEIIISIENVSSRRENDTSFTTQPAGLEVTESQPLNNTGSSTAAILNNKDTAYSISTTAAFDAVSTTTPPTNNSSVPNTGTWNNTSPEDINHQNNQWEHIEKKPAQQQASNFITATVSSPLATANTANVETESLIIPTQSSNTNAETVNGNVIKSSSDGTMDKNQSKSDVNLNATLHDFRAAVQLTNTVDVQLDATNDSSDVRNDNIDYQKNDLPTIDRRETSGGIASAKGTGQNTETSGGTASAKGTGQNTETSGGIASAKGTGQNTETSGGIASAKGTGQKTETSGGIASAEGTGQNTETRHPVSTTPLDRSTRHFVHVRRIAAKEEERERPSRRWWSPNWTYRQQQLAASPSSRRLNPQDVHGDRDSSRQTTTARRLTHSSATGSSEWNSAFMKPLWKRYKYRGINNDAVVVAKQDLPRHRFIGDGKLSLPQTVSQTERYKPVTKSGIHQRAISGQRDHLSKPAASLTGRKNHSRKPEKINKKSPADFKNSPENRLNDTEQRYWADYARIKSNEHPDRLQRRRTDIEVTITQPPQPTIESIKRSQLHTNAYRSLLTGKAATKRTTLHNFNHDDKTKPKNRRIHGDKSRMDIKNKNQLNALPSGYAPVKTFQDRYNSIQARRRNMITTQGSTMTPFFYTIPVHSTADFVMNSMTTPIIHKSKGMNNYRPDTTGSHVMRKGEKAAPKPANNQRYSIRHVTPAPPDWTTVSNNDPLTNVRSIDEGSPAENSIATDGNVNGMRYPPINQRPAENSIATDGNVNGMRYQPMNERRPAEDSIRTDDNVNGMRYPPINQRPAENSIATDDNVNGMQYWSMNERRLAMRRRDRVLVDEFLDAHLAPPVWQHVSKSSVTTQPPPVKTSPRVWKGNRDNMLHNQSDQQPKRYESTTISMNAKKPPEVIEVKQNASKRRYHQVNVKRGNANKQPKNANMPHRNAKIKNKIFKTQPDKMNHGNPNIRRVDVKKRLKGTVVKHSKANERGGSLDNNVNVDQVNTETHKATKGQNDRIKIRQEKRTIAKSNDSPSPKKVNTKRDGVNAQPHYNGIQIASASMTDYSGNQLRNSDNLPSDRTTKDETQGNAKSNNGNVQSSKKDAENGKKDTQQNVADMQSVQAKVRGKNLVVEGDSVNLRRTNANLQFSTVAKQSDNRMEQDITEIYSSVKSQITDRHRIKDESVMHYINRTNLIGRKAKRKLQKASVSDLRMNNHPDISLNPATSIASGAQAAAKNNPENTKSPRNVNRETVTSSDYNGLNRLNADTYKKIKSYLSQVPNNEELRKATTGSPDNGNNQTTMWGM